MRVIVLSDVHGNLPALQLLLLKEQTADVFISLGDVVNYGPWSNECVELLATYPAGRMKLIRGNHEEFFISGQYSDNGLAGRFFNFCHPQFTKYAEIGQYIDSLWLKGWLFKHTIDNKVVYPDTEMIFNFNAFIGHSHHQSIHKCDDYTIVNVGSAGQNRQYINCIDYAELIIPKMKYTLKHIIYDESMIINEMKSRDYAQEFIDYYSKKQRI